MGTQTAVHQCKVLLVGPSIHSGYLKVSSQYHLYHISASQMQTFVPILNLLMESAHLCAHHTFKTIFNEHDVLIHSISMKPLHVWTDIVSSWSQFMFPCMFLGPQSPRFLFMWRSDERVFRIWHVHLKLLIRCKYAKRLPRGFLWNANTGCKQRWGGSRFWCSKITEVVQAH